MRTLQRYLGWAAIPNLTLWIIALQVCAYIALRVPMQGGDQDLMLDRLVLYPDRVLAGEWWRLASFVILPPFGFPLFDFFAFWLFYLMGTSLEGYWGTFRFNLYVWIWWLATVSTALLLQVIPATNYGLQQGVFLAFAWLNPEFTIMLFFILPVKIRYLAWLTWFLIGMAFLAGPNPLRVMTIASVANFLIYFGPELRERIGSGTRRMQREATRMAHRPPDYRHKCTTCGVTDRDAPQLEFRYCSQCAGQLCYCSDHIRSHEHVHEVAKTGA